MNRWSANRRLVAIIVLVVICVGGIRHFAPLRSLDQLSSYAPSEYWLEIAEKAIAEIGADGPYLTVNPKDTQSGINLFLYDSQSSDGFPFGKYRNVCAYLADGQNIVCDVQLLIEVGDYLKLDRRVTREVEPIIRLGRYYYRYTVELGDELSSEERDEYNKYLLIWVLSHELGHLLSRHEGRSHFRENSVDEFLSRIIPTASFPNAYRRHSNEFEADAYSTYFLNGAALETLVDFIQDLSLRPRIGEEYLCELGDSAVARCRDGKPLPSFREMYEEALRGPTGSHPELEGRLDRLLDLARAKQSGLTSPSFSSFAAEIFESP